VHDLGNDGGREALFDVAAEQESISPINATHRNSVRSRYHACTRIEGLCSCCPPGAGDGYEQRAPEALKEFAGGSASQSRGGRD